MKDIAELPISPTLKWALSDPKNAIPITGWEFIILFGFEKIVPVRKGVINFRIKNRYYYYSIYETELLEKLNFTSVRIRFDASDLSQIHLFSVDDDDYLETIKPSPRADRTKYRRSKDSRNGLKTHHDAIKKIEANTREKLDRYKKIVSDVHSKHLPIEIINPATDSKEVIDQAELNYFNETLGTVRILEETRKQKERKGIAGAANGRKAKSAGEKYKFL
jgi:hypothetical protein